MADAATQPDVTRISANSIGIRMVVPTALNRRRGLSPALLASSRWARNLSGGGKQWDQGLGLLLAHAAAVGGKNAF